MILNFIAAGMWAALFVGVGYLCGHALEHMLGEIARDFGLVMLAGFAVLLIGFHLAHRHRKRRRAAALAQRPS